MRFLEIIEQDVAQAQGEALEALRVGGEQVAHVQRGDSRWWASRACQAGVSSSWVIKSSYFLMIEPPLGTSRAG